MSEQKEKDDARTDADEHQEQLIAEVSAEVASAAIDWQRAQAATKGAKKAFDLAVERLQRIVNDGPERLPLFDQPTERPSYEPPLEQGQCRVKIIQIDPDTDESDVPEQFVPEAVVVMRASSTDSLSCPGVNDETDFYLDEDRDDYEVLEHWPNDKSEATIYVPPLRFGPNKPEESPQADPEAWKRKLVSSLNIPKGTVGKLNDAGIETVEVLSLRMQQHGNDWYRDVPGLGPKAAEKVADAFEEFWKEHPEAA